MVLLAGLAFDFRYWKRDVWERMFRALQGEVVRGEEGSDTMSGVELEVEGASLGSLETSGMMWAHFNGQSELVQKA